MFNENNMVIIMIWKVLKIWLRCYGGNWFLVFYWVMKKSNYLSVIKCFWEKNCCEML